MKLNGTIFENLTIDSTNIGTTEIQFTDLIAMYCNNLDQFMVNMGVLIILSYALLYIFLPFARNGLDQPEVKNRFTPEMFKIISYIYDKVESILETIILGTGVAITYMAFFQGSLGIWQHLGLVIASLITLAGLIANILGWWNNRK